MILFLLLTIFLFIYVRNDKAAVRLIFHAYIASFAILLMKQVEVAGGFINYFISDEVGYYFSDISSLRYDKDRALWYLINIYIRDYDIFGELGIKLINIPIASLGIIYLARIFGVVNKYYRFIYAVPYLLVLMTMNLRDVFLLTAIISFAYNLPYLKLSRLLVFLILLLVVIYLRPVMIFVMLIAGGLTILRSTIKTRGVQTKEVIYFLSGTVVLLLSVYSLFGSRLINLFDKYSTYVDYNYNAEKEYGARLEEKGVDFLDVRGDRWYNYSVGGMRYILSPLPSSLMLRLSQGGGTYGMTDDFIRFLNQLCYYYFLVMLAINFRYFRKIIRNLTNSQMFIMFMLASNLAIYSFLSYGGTHQRTKVPFQLFIFIMFILLKQQKEKKWLS
jgi:hypothetical protein